MDSFNERSRFCYDPNSDTDGEDGFSGLLDIFVHHARNIHNICIYNNQDVYAKFSLTYSPDETLSTRIIIGGGKNPEFNENLRMKITQLDSVLKCEIWMFSRARIHMEDQLLGFALVPMSSVAGKGKVTQDFTLSSTDLFHSPAGTVQLTLFLHTTLPIHLSPKSSESVSNSSISSEVVLLDRQVSKDISNHIEYERIEFPDINMVKQNQQMVTEFFERNSSLKPFLLGPGSFLHLGAFSQPVDDYEMTLNSSEENNGEYVSPNGSIQNSEFFGSTTTSLSDDRNSGDSIDKKGRANGESSNSHVASLCTDAHQSPGASPETPTSKKENEIRNEDSDFPNKDDENSKESNMNSAAYGPVFPAPLSNINLEAEQSAMQKQIVDMYMRSMQQFTESLAKMKLPMDLDKPESNDNGDIIQQNGNNNKTDMDEKKTDGKKKDGSRVFYGSRAFF